MIFPEGFDVDIYKKHNNDLKEMNNTQLINHYKMFGINEGRKSSTITNRNELTSYINSDMKCLEIGPFDCPVLTGNNIDYFDVLNQNDLKIRAININRVNNLNNIPFIKYVSNNADLSIINDTFDVVLSCHSIEHQIDFIGHLNDVSKILHNNGYYIIICPDKRYSFDHFIKETTIADIIFMNTFNNINTFINSQISLFNWQWFSFYTIIERTFK